MIKCIGGLALLLLVVSGCMIGWRTPTATLPPTLPTLTPTASDPTPTPETFCYVQATAWMTHLRVYADANLLTPVPGLILHQGEPIVLVETNGYGDGYLVELADETRVWIPAYMQPVACE